MDNPASMIKMTELQEEAIEQFIITVVKNRRRIYGNHYRIRELNIDKMASNSTNIIVNVTMDNNHFGTIGYTYPSHHRIIVDEKGAYKTYMIQDNGSIAALYGDDALRKAQYSLFNSFIWPYLNEKERWGKDEF